MLQLESIKGILFDYGGTIDSNGLHWAEVIRLAYQAAQIEVTDEAFRAAYVHGERTMAKNPLVQPTHTFLDMMLIKANLQLNWLLSEQHLPQSLPLQETAEAIARYCYVYARQAIEAARPMLTELSVRYPMVLVSNFYGNIGTVLYDFQLDHLFCGIIESAVVGIRKPDPAIFQLGVKRLNLNPKQVVVIGDSHDKDIIPATTLGCQTIWLKSIGWSPYSGTETADLVITDFDAGLREVFVYKWR